MNDQYTISLPVGNSLRLESFLPDSFTVPSMVTVEETSNCAGDLKAVYSDTNTEAFTTDFDVAAFVQDWS